MAKCVGQSVNRNDGWEKATGYGLFTHDVTYPNMLYAKVLRSPYAHAKVVSIDTSAAEALPGVAAVCTFENTTNKLFNTSATMVTTNAPEEPVRDQKVFTDEPLYIGDEIAAVLEKAGIRVLHDKTLHDYPQYSGAYDRSLATVERYLERYPSIVFVLDVHRDAISDSNGTMYKVISGVAGLNAAQMSFVIGTDGGGLNHPHWQENLKLAAAIQQTLCNDYPTLMRPITVRNSRYNQHTTTGSLLVEMGAAGNSLDEALLSARLLGDAIVRTMLVQENVPPAASVIH